LADEKLRFYLDENMPLEIGNQLRARGIELVSVSELGVMGESDEAHLRRATDMGYVLCTHDSDFIELATGDMEHAGIVFGQQDVHHIGAWVSYLELMHAVYSPEEMRNLVEYV
jgi:hypothetical protein